MRGRVATGRSVERTLGLICGEGVLPRRMAEEARARGWRVVAFTFDGAPDMSDLSEDVVPSRLTELGAFFAAVQGAGVEAVVFSGRFSMPSVLRADVTQADSVSRGVVRSAGSRIAAPTISSPWK